jgi:hypothetical protein
MSPIRIDAPASSAEHVQPSDTSRTIFKALLLVSTLLSGGLMALPADAGEMLITTTGTITAGSETGGLFGLPTATTSLVGDTYTLSTFFGSLGSNYTTNGTGGFASDFETPGVGGYAKATVNGHSLTVTLTNALSSSLIEDRFGLDAANQGTDASGNYVNFAQSLSCTSACVPYADLLTPFFYALGASDFGADTYTYEGAGFPAAGTPVANFSGTPISLDFQVPEPDSWALLATGLLGLGMLVRRRRA